MQVGTFGADRTFLLAVDLEDRETRDSRSSPVRTTTSREEQTDVIVISSVCSSVTCIFLDIHSSL